MICKKEFDNEHKSITLKFISHNKCVAWTFLEEVIGEYVFDKEIKDCLFTDSFIILSKIKNYKKIFETIKSLDNKIVIEISNKEDKKIIPYLIKYGFVNIKENYYEFQRSIW